MHGIVAVLGSRIFLLFETWVIRVGNEFHGTLIEVHDFDSRISSAHAHSVYFPANPFRIGIDKRNAPIRNTAIHRLARYAQQKGIWIGIVNVPRNWHCFINVNHLNRRSRSNRPIKRHLNHIETPCSFERFAGISAFFTENVIVGELGEGLEKLAGIYFSGKALAVFPRRYRRLGNSKNIAQPFLRKALVRAKCLNISPNEIFHRFPFSTADKSLTG